MVLKRLKSPTFTTEFSFQFSEKDKQVLLPTKGHLSTSYIQSQGRGHKLGPQSVPQYLKVMSYSPHSESCPTAPFRDMSYSPHSESCPTAPIPGHVLQPPFQVMSRFLKLVQICPKIKPQPIGSILI